jgi:SPP1 gp7 family putative phage head morphogenesis protein
VTKRALPFNVPFTDAARHFAAKVPLPRAEFDLLSDWAKLRAFTVATVTKARVLNEIQGAVQMAIDDGLTMADFNLALDEILDVPLRPWHAETVFRTNIQSAYGCGRLQQQRAQKDDFPFLQLHEIDDTSTRRTHHAVDGTVQPVGSPWWRRWYPPSDYNCRGHAESLTADEARAIGVSPVNIIGDASADGDFAGPGASDAYVPNLSTLDPRLSDSVRRAIREFDPAAVDD